MNMWTDAHPPMVSRTDWERVRNTLYANENCCLKEMAKCMNSAQEAYLGLEKLVGVHGKQFCEHFVDFVGLATLRRKENLLGRINVLSKRHGFDASVIGHLHMLRILGTQAEKGSSSGHKQSMVDAMYEIAKYSTSSCLSSSNSDIEPIIVEMFAKYKVDERTQEALKNAGFQCLYEYENAMLGNSSDLQELKECCSNSRVAKRIIDEGIVWARNQMKEGMEKEKEKDPPNTDDFIVSMICLQTLGDYRSQGNDLAWRPDGKVLAGDDSEREYSFRVRCWNGESMSSMMDFPGHEREICSLAWRPDGKLLASASRDSSVRLWDAESKNYESKKLVRTLHTHSTGISSVAWRPDGKLLASGGVDATVRLWNAENGSCLQKFSGHSKDVSSVAWRPDGRVLASGSDDGTIRLWSDEREECLQKFSGTDDPIHSVAWRSDGKILASGGTDGTVRLWDCKSERCLRVLRGHKACVNSVAWRPDGNVLASGSGDKIVKLWDSESGTCLRTLLGHSHPVKTVTWRPDGKVLASGGKAVMLWG